MNHQDQKFNLDQLSMLSDLPKRTIRYYLQIGLLEKPTGVGRGSHYGKNHLEQLVRIRKWQQAGLSLERIQSLLSSTEEEPVPLPPRREAGTVEAWSHVVLKQGVELMIDPQRADLSPEQLHDLIRELMDLLERIQK